MAYKQLSSLVISEGGTGGSSHTAYGIITGGIASTSALQDIAPGITNMVLTSSGAAVLPIWISLPTFFNPLAADPGSPAAGDVWYNTTTDLFKGAITGIGAGTWTIKADLTFAVYDNAACGTPSDAISFGGQNNSSVEQSRTVRYDGGSNTYSTKASLNTARKALAGAGSATDGLSFGGSIGVTLQNLTERYDGIGDAWTNKANMNTARDWLGGAGTAADTLSFGGEAPATSAVTERYDGTGNSWTAKTNLNTARWGIAGAGTASDGLSFGGNTGGAETGITERYDGGANTWTNKTSLNLARRGLGGSGTAADALSFAGASAGNVVTVKTERYDGVGNTWTDKTNLNAPARMTLGGAGSSGGSAIAIGGYDDGTLGNLARTEIYDGSTITIVTFTTAP